jgi:putative acetyltransferase
MNTLRPLKPTDRDAVLQVYRQAVASCEPQLYTAAQRQAWAQQADSQQPSGALLHSLSNGIGLVCTDPQGCVLAFAVREPADRLALLYCQPSHQRQGLGRQLLHAQERQAHGEGIRQLRTEASLISRPLFCRHGWRVLWREELLINSVPFLRFRLAKRLEPILEPWPKPSCSSSSKKFVS